MTFSKGSDRHLAAHRQPPDSAWSPSAGPIALAQVAMTCTAVVGFFAAASQPLGWLSAAQALLCAAMGALLWFAESDYRAWLPSGSRKVPDRLRCPSSSPDATEGCGPSRVTSS